MVVFPRTSLRHVGACAVVTCSNHLSWTALIKRNKINTCPMHRRPLILLLTQSTLEGLGTYVADVTPVFLCTKRVRLVRANREGGS